MPNDGCYSKQGATSYLHLQTFCVRQILRMRYWVMVPNEVCIRMSVHWAANEIHYQTYIFLVFWLCGTDWKCIQKIWHLRVFHVPNLVNSFHWIKSNSFYSIALQVYFCIHITYFLHLKNISSKNIRFIKKIIVLTCDIWQSSITSQPVSNYLFKMDRL